MSFPAPQGMPIDEAIRVVARSLLLEETPELIAAFRPSRRYERLRKIEFCASFQALKPGLRRQTHVGGPSQGARI